MKKSLSIILAAFMLISLLLLSACASSVSLSPAPEYTDEVTADAETPLPETDASSTEVPSTEALTPEPVYTEPLGLVTELADGAIESIKAQVEGFKTLAPDTSTPLEGVPVYYEEALVYNVPVVSLDYCKEACEYYGSASMAKLSELLACCPNTAFRKCEGRGYLVYDTETGYRVFVFTDKQHGYGVRVGMPVIVERGREFEYADFSVLATGDPIDSVCEVDPVTEIYKNKFSEYSEYPDPFVFNRGAERGVYYSSIHYLTNGILKIEYCMDEDMEIVIQGLTYSADRTLSDRNGDVIDYTILDIDLP